MPELKDTKIKKRTTTNHDTTVKRLDIHRRKHNGSTQPLDVEQQEEVELHKLPVYRPQFRPGIQGEIGQVKGMGSVKTFYSERNRQNWRQFYQERGCGRCHTDTRSYGH